MFELASGICDAIDLVNTAIHNHHNQVAVASYHLAVACGYSGEALRNIVIAAAMHDVGGLTADTRLKAVITDFEDVHNHAEKGYRLLSVFEPFTPVAEIIRFHHSPWMYGRVAEETGEPIPRESQILLMADRLAVSILPGENVLMQAGPLTEKIISQTGSIYEPSLVEAFSTLALRDSFWLDVMSQNFREHMVKNLHGTDLVFGEDRLEGALRLLSGLIDFRSVFTASHSKGVSAVAEALAKVMHMSDTDCVDLRVAGYLHDIGKLAIPTEIIEKPGRLDDTERKIINAHAYYTGSVLSHLTHLTTIKAWAANHHENPDGSGYPYRLRDTALDLGARIMKIADVYVALMEERPYRKSAGTAKTLEILYDMAAHGQAERLLVDELAAHIDEVEASRAIVETQTRAAYEKFIKGLASESVSV